MLPAAPAVDCQSGVEPAIAGDAIGVTALGSSGVVGCMGGAGANPVPVVNGIERAQSV